jgi:hypothetical protein
MNSNNVPHGFHVPRNSPFSTIPPTESKLIANNPVLQGKNFSYEFYSSLRGFAKSPHRGNTSQRLMTRFTHGTEALQHQSRFATTK